MNLASTDCYQRRCFHGNAYKCISNSVRAWLHRSFILDCLQEPLSRQISSRRPARKHGSSQTNMSALESSWTNSWYALSSATDIVSLPSACMTPCMHYPLHALPPACITPCMHYPLHATTACHRSMSPQHVTAACHCSRLALSTVACGRVVSATAAIFVEQAAHI